MTNKSEIEQSVCLALYQNSFSRSELKEIYVNNSSDQENFNVYQPTATNTAGEQQYLLFNNEVARTK